MNADGSDPQNLTPHPGESGASASFSPDGSRIVFQSRRLGPIEPFTMNTDGSEVRRLTGNDLGLDIAASWSPDGRLIAFTKFRDFSRTRSAIFVIRPDGSSLKQLTPWSTYGTPVWSPDGNSIVFADELGGECGR